MHVGQFGLWTADEINQDKKYRKTTSATGLHAFVQNNIESKIDAINSSKENEEEYEDISFNLEDKTDAKLDTEITEADGDNLSINRPSSKIGLLLGNIVKSFSPLSFEKYSRPSSKMEE